MYPHYAGGILLTDAAIRRLKPKERPYKRADGGGLYMLVTKTARLWRLKYRRHGKEQLLSIGAYPDVSLADARDARDQAKKDLAGGKTPAARRRAAGPESFEVIAREWHKLQAPSWTPRHAADVLDSLESLVFPEIGADSVTVITAPMVLAVLRKIEGRPAVETARRVRQRVSAVFVYAIATGRGENDPAAIVRGAMAPVIRKHQPALVELEAARAMLRKVEGIPARPLTRLAMRFLALTVVRPSEAREARWPELGEVWKVPADRMKMKREHWVPLSRQASEAIDAAKHLARDPTQDLPVFPGVRSVLEPMTEGALRTLLQRAGFKGQHVPHGWRSTFSTVMNERFPADRHVIDLMLAHVKKDRTEAAYNRAEHLQRRRELAQLWADLLLEGFPPAMELLTLPRR
jgi:integrase